MFDEATFKSIVRGERPGLGTFLMRWGLRVASLPFSAVVRFRNVAFDTGLLASAKAVVPVVSVGNLTVGGTGKTPTVEFIARWFRDRGVRVAILSRGYGSSADGPNDEALVLEENLPDVPHLQGPKRSELAAIAVEELESELLILDDGFQHRRLKRDLDIVLIDATDPFGEGWLLPGGLLREPTGGLKRAQVVILTRIEQVSAARRDSLLSEIERRAPRASLATMRLAPTGLQQEGGKTAPLDFLKGKQVMAFCGIGNPGSFFASLTNLGANVVDRRTYPDHHSFDRSEVLDLASWIRDHRPDVVITTQKDIVKLRLAEIGAAPLWALRVEAVVEQGLGPLEREFERLLSTQR